MSITLPIKLKDPSINKPCYAYPGDAGMDLCSTEPYVLEPFERAAVACGFSLAIPEGYAGLVLPRSGLAQKHGISLVNSPGLIDSGYRGEIKVILINLDKDKSFEISVGDRIAQLIIVAIPEISLVFTEELPSSLRGVSGFGSSGI